MQDGLAIYIEDVDNNGVIEGQVVSKGKAKPIWWFTKSLALLAVLGEVRKSFLINVMAGTF
jgi:hypothetical protein